MADIESNINIDINTSNALASLRLLQREISNFQQVMSKTGALSSAQLGNMQQNLINGINSTGNFNATMQRVTTTTESFTNSLEKNKFSMGQYFRYSAGATKTFGRAFRTEFDTIEKVARERVKTLQTQYIKMGRDGSGAMNAIAVRPLTLDMNDLGTKTAIAAQKQQLFTQLMRQGSTELLNFGKNTQWAGRQLMVGFTIPLGIMGAAAAREFKAIEEQVLRLERVYGDFTTTMADTEKMTGQIKELATEFTKYGLSVAKTVGLAADVAAMGLVGADLVAQVREASRLATLGGVEQEQALETTISLTSAFGVATEDLAKKTDFLNAVENQTITSIQDLTIAIPKAGPVVQQLGGDVEDLTFFLTAMREGGINASESANALKSGLASLINPTEEASTMLAGFGINLNGIVEANKGDVKGIVVDFASALDTLDPLNRAQAIEQLFGKFQFSRLSTLFQNVIKEGSQAQRVLDLTSSSSAELAALSQRELGKIEASSLYQFQGAIEEFKAALAPIGETFMQVVTPIIKFGTDILNKFNEMDAGAKQFLVTLVGAVAGIGPVFLMTFGLIANGIANMIKGFMFVRGVLTGTGTATNVLAQQTDYMTTQQLEAAAIATSLGQVHTNLTQTFNVEAAAVRNLAGAYGQAIAAQAQFTGPIVGGGRGARPKKMARGGILRGPGTGTSDSIPAMLSDGEAVIPAESVARFPAMVAGLIAGNIPGFKDGHFAHLGPGQSFTGKQLLGMPGLTGLTDSVRKKLEVLSRVTPNAKADILHSWGVQMNSKVNQNLANLRGATPGAEAGALATQFSGRDIAGRYGEAAKLSGSDINDPQLQKELTSYDKAMSAKIRDLKKNGIERFVDTDEQLKALPENQKKLVGSLETADREVVKQIGKENKKLVAFRKQAVSTVRDVRIGPGLSQQQRDAIMNDPEGNRVLGRGYDGGTRRKVGQSDQATKAGGYGVMSLSAQKAEEASTKATKEKTKATRQRVKIEEKIVKQETQMLKEAKEKDPRRVAAGLKAAETRRLNAQAAQSQPAGRSISSRFAGKGGMIGMGAAGAMMAASSMGGPVGGAMGSIAGPLMGAAMALQMLPGPVGIVVAGLTAVAGVGIAVKQSFDGAMNKVVEFADTLGTGTNAMNRLAEFTGSVTGSQEKDLQREAQMAQFQGVSDPSVGKQFLESEAGKAMTTSIADGIKSGGTNSIANQVYQQMATGIATGAVDSETAKSIVNALSEQMKDPSLAILVNGKLDKLLGPNGENLFEDRIEISLALGKESQIALSSANQLMTSLPDINSGIANGVTQATALIGIGAAVGSIIPGIGTAVGAGVGAIAGGISALALALPQTIQYAQNLGAATGAVAANGVMALQQNQALLDSLDIEYEKRIQNAIAAGDLAKAEELQTQQAKDRTKLLEQNAKTIDMATAAYKKADTPGFLGMGSGVETAALGQAVDKAIETTFADDPLMQAAAVQARGQVASAGGLDNTQEYTMKLMLATGDIPPQVLSGLLSSFGEDKKVMDATMNILTNLGTADGGQALAIANSFVNPDGTPKKDLQQQFLMNFKNLNPEESKNMLDFYNTIQMNGGDLEAVVSLSVQGQEELKTKFDEIEEITQGGTKQVTYQQIVEMDEDFRLLEKDQAYFDSLPPVQQRIFLQRYVTMFETVSDKEATDWYAKNIGATGGGVGLSADAAERRMSSVGIQAIRAAYAANAGRQAVEAFNSANAGFNNQAGGNTTPRGGGGGGGGSASQPDLPTEAERYQASLSLISEQEEKINKAYDERLKALDEIQKAQEAIAEKQKDQLDLSEALTKGDIASAARAMRAMRVNEARRASEAQRVALEKARERELSQVSYGGLTRAQLEQRLQALESAANARVAAGQPRANGGYISGPGNGTSDSIPAMLSNGEYVIRAAAVKALGVDKLNMLNMADKFAMGGLAGKKAALLNARKSARFNTGSLSAPSYGVSAGMAPEAMLSSGVAGSSAPTNTDNSVYNYNINVNASTNANPDQIASVVVRQIQDLESRRVRRNYVSG